MEPLNLMQNVPTESQIIERAQWYYDLAKTAMNSDSPIADTRTLKKTGQADYHELELKRNQSVVKSSVTLMNFRQYLERATLHDVGRTTSTNAKHQAYNFIDYMPDEFSEQFK
ncbi:hypothetical protein ACGRWF_07830 [Lacticaseibacillus paracasei]|uniref:hypothetical protein n=1 Tax=Lacticaseibacillus paracasei TaxID=1597 RepID=UPI0038512A71